jgi:transposase InsO family protein
MLLEASESGSQQLAPLPAYSTNWITAQYSNPKSLLYDKSLNENQFLGLGHARELLETFRDDHDRNRPYSSLGGMTPAEFAARGPHGGPMDQANPSLAVQNLNLQRQSPTKDYP